MELIFDIVKADHTTPDMVPTFTFKHAGGVIGRNEQSDWCLPDPKRQVSNIHAVISFDKETFYLTDKSTNGTYLDGQDASLNKNEPYPIKHGDTFEIGSVQIKASIKQDPSTYHFDSSSIEDMIPDDSFLSDEPIEELLATDEELALDQMLESTASSSQESDDQLLKEQFISPELNGSQSTKTSQNDQSFKDEFSEFTGKNSDEIKASDDPVISKTQNETQPKKRTEPATQSKILAALAKGLDIDIDHIEDDVQLAYDVGILLRTSVSGIQQLLRTRTELKNNLSSQATTIQAQGNNPIKFSHDTNEALNILINHKPGYLQGIEAIRQSCRDIQAHQLALNDACHNTLDGVIEKLSPKTLVYRFVQDGVKSRYGFGNADGQYWKSYIRLHEKITSDKDWRNALLEQDFAKHYETQLQLLNAALRV
ncbi:MAG: type VI secretion system-associated FHA domain protein TagH [Aliivibrio sp.]|uniref:type VI secretion system-associated FHA domain protein TagH n=1 Tax=Aliivibrio sp. TaxID=1872443 RepID=UPI001A4F9EBD|nr:type VI secretion system-associated FHA domain protein TagH [Aliivibrio sp.]